MTEAAIAAGIVQLADAIGINNDRLARVEDRLAAVEAELAKPLPPSETGDLLRQAIALLERIDARLVDERANEHRMTKGNSHGR